MKMLTIGTRQSALALCQSGWVKKQLENIAKDLDLASSVCLHPMTTRGDRILDVSLSKIGGKGLFVEEIQEAMLTGKIDMAVHSLKDLPSELPNETMIAAVPTRELPWDALISKGVGWSELPIGARIGTSSLRRASQLLNKRPDLQIIPLRGNIDTRLKKLDLDELDAIVLAAAGLRRMNWDYHITEMLSPDICIPAVGQGALALEARRDDQQTLEWVKHLHDDITWQCVRAERLFLKLLEGGCEAPIAAWAHHVDNGQLEMQAMVGSPDGRQIIRETLQDSDPLILGQRMAELLISRGARQWLHGGEDDVR